MNSCNTDFISEEASYAKTKISLNLKKLSSFLLRRFTVFQPSHLLITIRYKHLGPSKIRKFVTKYPTHSLPSWLFLDTLMLISQVVPDRLETLFVGQAFELSHDNKEK